MKEITTSLVSNFIDFLKKQILIKNSYPQVMIRILWFVKTLTFAAYKKHESVEEVS